MFKSLKWLFKDAPTNIIKDKTERTCDYCGADSCWVNFGKTGMTICHDCLKKIADKVLKIEQ